MKNITKIACSLGLAGCAVINIAVAADPGWYIGANVGRSMGNIDDGSISSQLMATGSTSVSIDDNDRDTGYKLFGGYQYNKNFALEGGYFNLGQLGYTATTTPAGTLTGEASISGLNLDLVGTHPFANKFSAFGRFGLNYAKTDDTFSNTGLVPVPANADPGKNALNYKYGVGLRYDFTEALGMRAEVERYRINDAVGNKADVDLISIGLVYRFGEKQSHPAKRHEESRVIVPVRTKTAEYCSVLDIEFDIKQNQVHAEDMEKLAALATYMKKYPKTTAVIEGHSDNVGTSDYNLKLSQQRADSVVEYLVKEQHINSSRLSAVGYGETRPIAHNTTSEGQQSNRRINAVIACVDDIEGLKVAPTRVTMALNIDFDPYKHTIQPKYRAELAHVANYMKANPSVTAMVEGYADRVVGTGTTRTKVDPETAMKISQRRAQSVVNYLNQLGVASSRLNIASYGQTGRVTYGTTLDAQQENRRVNIILIYPKK